MLRTVVHPTPRHHLAIADPGASQRLLLDGIARGRGSLMVRSALVSKSTGKADEAGDPSLGFWGASCI